MRTLPLAALLSVLAGAALGLVVLPPQAGAGTAVRLDIDDLVENADLVIEGVVTGRRVWDLRSEGRIETEYEIEVERTFWGDDLPTRAIRVPGGELPDGTGLLLPGMPTLDVGERSVLFLTEPGSTGMRAFVGLAQGKFEIVSTLDGPLAVGAGTQTVLWNPATGALTPPGASQMMPYADLVARVEAAAAVRSAQEAETEDEE